MSGSSDSDQPIIRNITSEQIEVKIECPEDYADDYDDDQPRRSINDLFAISNSFYEEPDSSYEIPGPMKYEMPEVVYEMPDLDPPQRHVYTREYGGQYDGWNRTSTRHLISLYRRYRDRIGSLEIKSKKQMWDIISKSLAKEFKLKFTAAHCENRWRVLERNYRKIIVQQRNGRPNRTFEFFDDLNNIFRKHKDRDRKPMAPPLQPKIPKIEPPSLPNLTVVRNPPPVPQQQQPLTFLRFVPNTQSTSSGYPLLITSVKNEEPKEDVVKVNGVVEKKERRPRRPRKRNIFALIRKDMKFCSVERLKVEKQKLAVKEKKLALMEEANKIMVERNEILKDFIKKVTGGVQVLNGLVTADLV